MAAPWIVDDRLWAVIEPLLPVRAPGTPGPARMDDRLVLQGILFVLFTGIGWEDLPQELGFGSGMTCWRRLRDWQSAGVFGAVHETMLAHCHAAGLIDFDRVIPDGSHVRAKKGAPDTGPSPVDRRKTGSKHHILTCGNGLPLAITLSAANVNDHLVLPELLDRVRPLRGRPGRPRRRIATLIADKGYDYPRVYDELRQRGITAYIPRRGTHDKVSGRWIVEQSLALLHQYRRLAIRWERRTDIHHGFLDLAAALICWRRLSNRTC
ncbi:IS5 family transposase [Nocardia takedensis]|uniref:IS5 family transposase n=1 Tax=Nocardia takedensis TaxID=259390 RepID=UPI000A30EF68|nr:IS5 family transposase [Nocardia takedensis]